MVSPWILRLLNSLFSSLFLAFLIPLGGRRGGLDYAVGVPILGTRSFASARPAHATEQIAFEPQNESKRPVTVADAIEMTKIAGSPARPIAQFAPNGKKFVLVVTKGNIKRNSNEYSLLLWSTSDLSDSAAPKTILTMSSTSNRPGIQELTWMDDNDTVAFLGENPGELQQLYTFNIKTRLLRRITDQPTNVIAYSMTPKGDTIAYVAEEPVVSIFNARAQRQGVRVSRQYLRELLAGRRGGKDVGDDQLFLQSGLSKGHRISTPNRIAYGQNRPYLSPDGKYIVIVTEVTEIPDGWRDYSDPFLQPHLTAKYSPGELSYLHRCMLIDTGTGSSQILLNAPLSWVAPQIFWSPDSQSVIVANTYLPLDSATGDVRKTRQSESYTVEVRVPGGDFTEVSQGETELLGWIREGTCLASAGKPRVGDGGVSKMLFCKAGGEWKLVKGPAVGQGVPEIVVEEEMNSRPKVYASGPKTKGKVLLYDLNPHFKDLKFGKVEEITWRGPKGHEVKGGLYYPVDYRAGRKYPLVIQTHGWSRHRFWIDGPWITGYAAQILAGRGIMVLQAPTSYHSGGLRDGATPEEGPDETASFEAAIEYLDKRGLIDTALVGIMGFSRTCFHVKYFLTHADSRFAAASVTDGIDASYFQYMVEGNLTVARRFYRAVNGNDPFGEGLKSWMQNSTGFNADKVRTPLLIMALNPASLLFEWEWFAALTILAKPVDMIYMQDGTHILQRPLDRIISQQGNVDWFCFWLKGEEDRDPAKAEQYARWHDLRELAQDKAHSTR